MCVYVKIAVFLSTNPIAPRRRNAFAALAASRRRSDPIGKRSAPLGKLFQIRNIDMTYLFSSPTEFQTLAY